MITLKKIIEGVEQETTNELSGMMGQSPTTWDTPKAFAPSGAPVRTNEALPSKKLTAEEKRKLLGMVGQSQ
jgi:hypothetical protein